mgnify:CR=1 FL=1
MSSRAALKQAGNTDQSVLYIALDVGDRRWEVGVTDGGGRIVTRTIEARDFDELQEIIEGAEQQFDLPTDYKIVSCHEAGRDGFWIHRRLRLMGIPSGVVDPGSLQEPKKGDRAKTDRVDAETLVAELVRWCDGHRGRTFNLVRVPSPEDEDDRHPFREHEALIEEKTRLSNKIESLLKTQGIEEYPDPRSEAFDEWLDKAVTADGRDLGKYLSRRLGRIAERYRHLREHLKEVENERSEYLRGEGREENIKKARTLVSLKGIGEKTGHAFVVELYGWRNFQNRRQIRAYAGMDGQRYDSGEQQQDGPITRQGNSRIRRLAIQMARNWLIWQPDSELTQWARRRFETEQGRVSNRGIVALASKLLNRLRVLLDEGEMPRGAVIGEVDF